MSIDQAKTAARSMALSALAAGAALFSGSAGVFAQTLPPLVAGEHFGNGWRVVTLPRQTKPPTRFIPERIDGRNALQLQAEGSYGNLVLALPGIAAPQRLRWSWRLQQPNPATDLRVKRGDDVAAKVCLSFDLPLSQIGFGERQLLRMARSVSGEPLPAATLCWAWGAREAVGSLIENPYSRRLRTIVLRNSDDPLLQWLDEDRDIAADFKRAFGDEADTVPPLVAVGVGADGDDTGGRSVAHIADLRFGNR
ncbi:MAG: DUF3047 domain-containing protein [Rubrivivax sp.]